ncbi:MAG: RloB family protein [Candidatus Delongbacteria bacterium]
MTRVKMELKQSVYIIGEGLTEKHYFCNLKDLKNYSYIVRPRFFTKNSIDQIQKLTKELLAGDVKVICVFDADVSQRNKAEKEKLNGFIKKYKDNGNVIICDSLPSIEFWFLIHYVQRNRHYSSYSELKKELLKYIESYDKTEKFLKKREWVQELVKRLNIAVDYASKLNPDEGSYSNIYKAIQFLEKY